MWNSNLSLIFSPYFVSTKAMGTNAKAMNASKLFPQSYPRCEYRGSAAMGNTAEQADLTTVHAPMALAACFGKQSIKYMLIGRYVNVSPMAKTALPRMGTTQ